MNETFDPTAAFYKAQNQRPATLESVDLPALAPFLRSLLVKDGTVTSAISAFFLEPVVTVQLQQIQFSMDIENRWLALPAGASLMRRQVMLTSAVDKRLFLFAESLLAIGTIPKSMQAALVRPDSNLGQILREDCPENRREGLWYGQQQLSDMPARVAACCDGNFISRTYRVVSQRRPIILITEHFPVATYQAASAV